MAIAFISEASWSLPYPNVLIVNVSLIVLNLLSVLSILSIAECVLSSYPSESKNRQVTGFLYFLALIRWSPCSKPSLMLVDPFDFSPNIVDLRYSLFSGVFLRNGNLNDAVVWNSTRAILSYGPNIFMIYLNEFFTRSSFLPCILPLTSTTQTKSIPALSAVVFALSSLVFFRSV